MLRKSRSTKEGREAAFNRMQAALYEANGETDDLIRLRIQNAGRYGTTDGWTREKLLILLAVALAERIVDAS